MKFQINEPSKNDEGNYKFVIQNEKGESISETVEVTDVVEEKKGIKSKLLKTKLI